MQWLCSEHTFLYRCQSKNKAALAVYYILYLKSCFGSNCAGTFVPEGGNCPQWYLPATAAAVTGCSKGHGARLGCMAKAPLPSSGVHVNPFLSTDLNDSWRARLTDPACSLCQHLMSSCVADVVKGEKVKPIFEEPPNPTNVEASLQRIKANDPSLTEINLNNIKVDSVVSFTSSQKGLFKYFQPPFSFTFFFFLSVLHRKSRTCRRGQWRELFEGLQGHQCLILNQIPIKSPRGDCWLPFFSSS